MTQQIETAEVTVFREAKAIIGESIWWNAHRRAVQWCDIDSGLLYQSPLDASTDGADDRVLGFPPPVSAYQPTADGGYIATDERSVFVCDESGGGRRTVATVEHRHPGFRFNEAKCDPFGNLVAGSMDIKGDPDGAIYVVSPEGACRILIGGVAVANGFEWSHAGRRMYFTDTGAETIYVGDYDGESLTNVEPFVSGQQSDGLARDVDGGFWNAINSEGLVVRWDADGNRTHDIRIPVGHVTSVGFGGDDLSTLFVSTARENLTEEQLEELPLTGSLFSIRTSTRGYPVHAFGQHDTI